jgi:putative ABC transport system permease protein
MRLIDHLEEVTWSFRKQRLRTALTAMGIAVGAFAITIMVGLAQGVQGYITSQFEAFGDRQVLFVFPEVARNASRFLDRLARLGKPADRVESDDFDAKRTSRAGLWISPEQVEKLKSIDGVLSVAPLTWLEVDAIALFEEGAEPDWFEIDIATMSNSPLVGDPEAGRIPALDADAQAVLSPHYADSFGLAPEELLGREVLVRVPFLGGIQRRFLFRDPSGYTAKHQTFRMRVIGLAERSPFSRALFASVPTARRMLRYQSGNEQILSEGKIGFQAVVRLRDDVKLKKKQKEIRALGLEARSVDDELERVKGAFLVIDGALTSFGLLALLVATLGIINTLLMAISERTREIGVMKALGATSSTVRRLFALEAAAIGFAGGVLGALGAVATGLVVNVVAARYLPVAEALEGYAIFVFPWWLLLGAVAFCTIIGGVSGLYPASRAARLDPVEALRRD